MWMQLLSLALSLYFAYVFVTYAEEVQKAPGCSNIASEKRELIRIYGYVKLVLGGLSALLILYLLAFGIGDMGGGMKIKSMKRRR